MTDIENINSESIIELSRKTPIFRMSILVIIWISLNALFSILLESINVETILRLFLSFFITIALVIIILFYIVPFTLKLPKQNDNLHDFFESIKLNRIDPLIFNLFISTGAFCIYFVVILIGSNLFGTYTLDITIIFGSPVVDFPNNYVRLGWFYFIYMIIPSIYEEITYRGVILQIY